MELALSIFWLLSVIWLIYRAARQNHALATLKAVDASDVEDLPSVAVIVPVRNEAKNIGPCIEAVTRQLYPAAHLRLYVVDDHSEDGTSAAVAALAKRGATLQLLASPPLPPGWVGKSHACWIGAQAVPSDTTWLCFIDSDVRLSPSAIASAVVAAQEKRFDILSLAPSQELVGFAERLIIPCGLYLLAFMRRLERVQAPESDDATATGKFMLVRHSTYDAIGGHAAIHSSIIEDVALARLMKHSGGHVELLNGGGLLRTRMYTGWRTLWPGLAKNITDMMGGPLPTVLVSAGGVALAWLAIIAPLLDIVTLERAATVPAFIAIVCAAIATCAALALHIAGALYFGIPIWYGFLFPLGYTVGAAIAFDSVRRHMTGHVEWKGRTYP